jgi:hypothetical protein
MVLGYARRKERNYCVTRRKLLTVVHFVKHFRSYLYGRRLTVRTDHSSLQWLLNFKDQKEQLARWHETLSEYEFRVEHRPGLKHGNADGLSRPPCRHPCYVGEQHVLCHVIGERQGSDSIREERRSVALLLALFSSKSDGVCKAECYQLGPPTTYLDGSRIL